MALPELSLPYNYWLKLISCDENKYINQVYNMMLNDIGTHTLKQNSALSVKQLLSRLGFMEVWVSQEVGNELSFLAHFKTRVNYISFANIGLSICNAVHVNLQDLAIHWGRLLYKI